MTADDLLRMHGEGIRGELIRGVFYEDSPNGAAHGITAAKLEYLLGRVALKRRMGHLMAGSGYLLERDPDTVRGADISYISSERMPLGVKVPVYSEIVPDLAVEVVSFDETLRDANDKGRMWLSYGVPLVWVVDPEQRTVHIHPLNDATTVLVDKDTLYGGDVLSGFSCRVSEIFDI